MKELGLVLSVCTFGTTRHNVRLSDRYFPLLYSLNRCTRFPRTIASLHTAGTRFAAVVAEWLRRLTRNQIPSGSVGSSPTDREGFDPVLPIVIWN